MREERIKIAVPVAEQIKASGDAARRAFARTLSRIDWQRDATAVSEDLSTVFKDGALLTFRRAYEPEPAILIVDYRREDEFAAVA